MRNLLLHIAYNGSRYHGYQVQQNAVSVAGTFQPVLEKILAEKVQLKGCSRTDTGVHANDFAMSFKTNCRIPCAGLVKALNNDLPPDMAALRCEEVDEEFHARYSCTGKRYLYQINNSPVKDPFRWKQVYDYRYPIDVAMCDRQCKDFIGTHDFSSLCSAGSSVEDHVRTVTACGMVREGDRVTFYVEGDGFLYNMVRIMVGTILEIAAGSKPQGCIPQILEQRDRAAAGFTAPAWGLYLDRVFYEQLPDDRMEG